MSFFVTGTDTGVGKTLVSCALLRGFAESGTRVIGMKPVAAGCPDDDVHVDVRQLRAASNVAATLGQMNPYSFIPAVAPHLAAQHVGVKIRFDRIVQSYHELAALADQVIVEGAGGFLVPLNDTQSTADLVQALGLPVILVVGMRLGCLNHALLTVEAIRSRKLYLAGWVANMLDADMEMAVANVDALRQRIDAPLLGVVPHVLVPDAEATALPLNIKLLENVG
jgi:dethiobiotin synthetase